MLRCPGAEAEGECSYSTVYSKYTIPNRYLFHCIIKSHGFLSNRLNMSMRPHQTAVAEARWLSCRCTSNAVTFQAPHIDHSPPSSAKRNDDICQRCPSWYTLCLDQPAIDAKNADLQFASPAPTSRRLSLDPLIARRSMKEASTADWHRMCNVKLWHSVSSSLGSLSLRSS